DRARLTTRGGRSAPRCGRRPGRACGRSRSQPPRRRRARARVARARARRGTAGGRLGRALVRGDRQRDPLRAGVIRALADEVGRASAREAVVEVFDPLVHLAEERLVARGALLPERHPAWPVTRVTKRTLYGRASGK